MTTYPTWPAGVPYEPLLEDWSTPQLFNPVLASSMNGGNTRRRPKTTLEYEKQKISIMMDADQLRLFKAFVFNDISKGTALFKMQVWDLDHYVWRVVEIDDQIAYGRMGVIKGKYGYRVSFTIAIQVGVVP